MQKYDIFLLENASVNVLHCVENEGQAEHIHRQVNDVHAGMWYDI